MKVSVIIPAAGTGYRANNDIPKQFLEIDGVPIIINTINLFNDIDEVESIIIPVHIDYLSHLKDLIDKYKCSKVKEITLGGHTRQDSVCLGLNAPAIKKSDIVLIHDAVRPFTSQTLIHKLINAADDTGAAIPIIKASDSLKEIDNNGNVIKTLDRECIGLVQTPEAFWTSIAIESFNKASAMGYNGMDSSSVVEFAGYKVNYIEGETNNIKITFPIDIDIAKIIKTQYK